MVNFVRVEVSDPLYPGQLFKFLDRTDCNDLHLTSIILS